LKCSIVSFIHNQGVLPEEFYDQKWLHKDRDKLAPNIVAITKRFNWVSLNYNRKVSLWVISSIVSESNLKKRGQVLLNFVQMAWQCYGVKNYIGCFEIVSALYSTPIYRLKKTWDLVSEAHLGIY
jgi:hypothetical protein